MKFTEHAAVAPVAAVLLASLLFSGCGGSGEFRPIDPEPGRGIERLVYLATMGILHLLSSSKLFFGS